MLIDDVREIVKKEVDKFEFTLKLNDPELAKLPEVQTWLRDMETEIKQVGRAHYMEAMKTFWTHRA